MSDIRKRYCTLIAALSVFSTLFIVNKVAAQEELQHQHKMMQQHKVHQGNRPSSAHAGGHGGGHGHHGMVHKDAKKFPTTAYNETKVPRAISQPTMPNTVGDPQKGKVLAYSNSKGRCLACHIMGEDALQAGDVGINLSEYGTLGRKDDEIFQQVWDARANNAKTLMPPFGTHEILNKHEVMHIVAYLKTLKQHVGAPQRPQLQQRNYLVAAEDFTSADEYIEQGAVLFSKPAHNGKSCASCHRASGDSKKAKAGDLTGVASRYPKYQTTLNKIINIDDRINVCRKNNMNSKPYKLGSKNINMLSSYIKYLSRNVAINVATGGAAKDAIQRGKAGFYTKAGQLNFSCADCHTTSAGKWLRGQPLSNIKPNGQHSDTASTWPKHFIAGHDLGLISLQQRIRHCQSVTRTQPLKLGSAEYTDMELYLTMLANGKPMLAPTKSKLRGQD